MNETSTVTSSGNESLLQFGAVGVMAFIFAGVALRLYNQLQGSNLAATTQLKEAHAAEIVRLELTHKVAFERLETAHAAAITRSDAAYQDEKARADRMEAELRDFNKLINDKLAGELVRASDIVREALEQTHAERRRT